MCEHGQYVQPATSDQRPATITMLRIGIVAGEPSGDYLGADLIREIQKQVPDVRIEGIAGPQLQAAGCKLLFPMEKLAVMGLIEVVGRYIELVRIRRQLIEHFHANPPDLFIGIDAPDFNLGLEESLHALGIKTVHYVSPSVWAWRSSRIHRIKRAVDLMLVLFPFELPVYQKHRVPVQFVGHPLADRIPPEHDKAIARAGLGLPATGNIIAIMPGSRNTELDKMLPVQLETAKWCSHQRADLIFITSVLTAEARQYAGKVRDNICPDRTAVDLRIYQDRAHEVLASADVALLTSGTVTLEALLFKLPMVVGYRVNWLTYQIFRALVQVKFAALPNLLADKQLVAEFLQYECVPQKMGTELLRLLDDSAYTDNLKQQFSIIRTRLQQNAGAKAATAVLSLMPKP